ncbi:MAG: MlaD family protein [Verrucomicrobiota bacterium]|jgi:paraquat-inducible protein B|nr:MlaD family protein [Verrucomicrobiota bacterium]
MSKKANSALVGGFVVGALALAFLGVVLLGGVSFFEKSFNFVAYFDESISGLDVGAPVDFQGVRIGTVTDVWLEFDRTLDTFFRPVHMQIENKRIQYIGSRKRDGLEEGIEMLVAKRGLRARLVNQSMLTGKLKVELGYFPDQPCKRVNRDDGIWEMPTIPSPLQQVTKEVTQLPLADIVRDIHRSLQGLADIIESPETRKTVSNLNATFERMEALLTTAEAQIAPLGENTTEVMQSTADTLNDLRQVLGKVNDGLAPFMASLTVTADQISTILDPSSFERTGMMDLMMDLKATSKSLRLLIDYLEQHPESIIRGKQN